MERNRNIKYLYMLRGHWDCVELVGAGSGIYLYVRIETPACKAVEEIVGIPRTADREGVQGRGQAPCRRACLMDYENFVGGEPLGSTIGSTLG